MTNISKHPCANKCTDFKDEQCKTCLVKERVDHSEAEFLVGDVVVLTNPFYTSDSNEIFEVKYIYGNGEIRITNGFQGKTFTSQEIRHASVAELNVNRRLTNAEQALGEVS